MGDQNVSTEINPDTRVKFIRHLLEDIKALELMIESDMIESGITRIGAEQEFCLVSDNWRPSTTAMEILRDLNDPHFTTELARYNLEINLDPLELKGNCFSNMEHSLKTLLDKARKTAGGHNTNIVLTGILPTISKTELEFDHMTPNPRYKALNDMLREQRGGDFELRLRGVDQLAIMHESVLFEACNTSFQMHLQIDPHDFIASYNWAQAISGPIMGISANSPLLLGRELWSETRIALFQQSIDTRSSSYALKDQKARVTFGDSWAYGTVADIFKNDISKYKIILEREIDSHSMEDLKNGKPPKLQALNMHNGTIYRWNRPCYGIGNGKAHVRIENRYIPAGPSEVDQIANFAFWVGLMKGRPSRFDDLPAVMDFRDAKANFIKAARTGKESVMNWLGELISVRDLITKELLPIAYNGLKKSNIDSEDRERLLGIIEQRAKKITGAQWNVRNYRKLRKSMKPDDALLALTKSMYENQKTARPIHEWPMIETPPKLHETAHLVGHIMSSQLFTINENDLAELAIAVMYWKEIHHVPVEDKAGNLCGLITWTHMKRFYDQQREDRGGLVSDIMTRNVHTATPETKISDAIALMKKHEIGCLPVVHDQHLVGIITITDVLAFDHG